jgi:hypothetical protein
MALAARGLREVRRSEGHALAVALRALAALQATVSTRAWLSYMCLQSGYCRLWHAAEFHRGFALFVQCSKNVAVHGDNMVSGISCSQIVWELGKQLGQSLECGSRHFKHPTLHKICWNLSARCTSGVNGMPRQRRCRAAFHRHARITHISGQARWLRTGWLTVCECAGLQACK